MASEHVFDDKGKVRPKPSKEAAEPQKDGGQLSAEQMKGELDPHTLTRMQQTLGNTAVQRFLAQRADSGPTEIDEDTAAGINAQRGSGQKLDEGVAGKAGQAMGQDFSDVNVHTDSQSDKLSRQLGAKAFTTGNDIFFREGAYDPDSSDGQRLISHELTHVVQQGGSDPPVQGKMTVNDPNDQYEAEADKVADAVIDQADEAAVQAQDDEEDVQLQEDEEEKLATQAQDDEEDVQLQEDEEEKLATQAQDDEEDVQLQEDEEEKLATQAQDDEEDVQLQDD